MPATTSVKLRSSLTMKRFSWAKAKFSRPSGSVRAEVLTALLADRALTATELADVAGVTKQTVSAHLAKLLAVEAQGRHCYFRLAGHDIAMLLESLMGVAFRTGSKASSAAVRRFASCCRGATARRRTEARLHSRRAARRCISTHSLYEALPRVCQPFINPARCRLTLRRRRAVQ